MVPFNLLVAFFTLELTFWRNYSQKIPKICVISDKSFEKSCKRWGVFYDIYINIIRLLPYKTIILELSALIVKKFLSIFFRYLHRFTIQSRPMNHSGTRQTSLCLFQLGNNLKNWKAFNLNNIYLVHKIIPILNFREFLLIYCLFASLHIYLNLHNILFKQMTSLFKSFPFNSTKLKIN